VAGTTSSQVDFVAYDRLGARVNAAQLDSTNAHSTIPSACLSCHGISSRYDPATNRIVDPFAVAGAPTARFLAFDPFSYLYSSLPGFTEADQREAFRRLNALVLQTRPAPATVDLINGMYAGAVTTPGAVPNDYYVPAGWANADASQDGKAMYDGVVKLGCRMCHTSASNPSLDFLQLSDFAAQSARIRSLVCGKTTGTVRGHAMPNAEHVSKRFWNSGARALVLGYTQPTQLAYPDVNASCDP